MPRLFAAAFVLLLCLPVTLAGDFKVLNPPSPGDPVYVIPPGICGNGVVEDGEECDPGYPDLGVEPDMGGATCETQGFNGGGEVSCTAKCTVDTSACDCETGMKVPATGQTRCWDRSGELTDCAGTGQDGDIRAGAVLAYTDNSDGTITDENTGLMWEKKNRSGTIHDYRRRYSWHDAFSVFVRKLNDTCDGAGEAQCEEDADCGAQGTCGFAGYRDWRMPNVKELQSIIHHGRTRNNPAVDPAFQTPCVEGCIECSCTYPVKYWSSTNQPSSPEWPLAIDFLYGRIRADGLSLLNHVRAVRGGLD